MTWLRSATDHDLVWNHAWQHHCLLNHPSCVPNWIYFVYQIGYIFCTKLGTYFLYPIGSIFCVQQIWIQMLGDKIFVIKRSEYPLQSCQFQFYLPLYKWSSLNVPMHDHFLQNWLWYPNQYLDINLGQFPQT